METFYSIQNSKNGTYLQFDSTQHILFVPFLDKAYYSTIKKVNAIINNCIKPAQRNNLVIVEYTPNPLSNTKAPNPLNRITKSQSVRVSPNNKPNKISMNIVRDVSTPCLKAIQPHLNPISNNTIVANCVKEYEEKERQIKKEICDLYHYIEFYDLSAAEGYKAYKALQTRLQKRREIKNTLIRFNIVSQATPDDIINGNLERRLSGLNNRKYECRAIPELFTGEDIVNEDK